MKHKLIALALAALPFTAFAADGLSYTYVEGNYVNLDHGTDGAGLRGSAEIANSGFYVTGQYAWLNADAVPDDVNVRARELGVGYHHGVSAKTDLIGELAYRNAEVEGGGNIDGGRASVGVRSAIGTRGEAYVKGNYYDASDYRGDGTGTVGGQFKFTDKLGVTAEVEAGNGDKAYLVGLRASFK